MRRKYFGVIVLAVVVIVLEVFEVRWLAEADYASGKKRVEELFAEMAGEVSMIEVGLLEGGEVEEAKGRFDAALRELREISYVVEEKGELLVELENYGAEVGDKAELARELKVLRSLVAGFVEKMAADYEGAAVSGEIFRKMNEDFLEFAENLPEAEWDFVRDLVAEVRAVANQVGVSAATVANCFGGYDEATLRVQREGLEKKLDEVVGKVEVINDKIRGEFDSSLLVGRLGAI